MRNFHLIGISLFNGFSILQRANIKMKVLNKYFWILHFRELKIH